MSSLPAPTQRMRQLALWLRATRLKAGRTQQQVAEAAELYTGVYGRIERAGMIPTVPAGGLKPDPLGCQSQRRVSG